FREDADPSERIFAVVSGKRGRRDAGPAHAVKAVAAADEIAGKLVGSALLAKSDFRRRAGELVDADIADFKQNRSTVGEPARNEILHHLLLAVNGHACSPFSNTNVVMRGLDPRIHLSHRMRRG